MRGIRAVRSENVDLLVRLPPAAYDVTTGPASLVDPVAQLKELADMVDRGLLTLEEYEHQRVVVLGG
jgi:hypothetical protein